MPLYLLLSLLFISGLTAQDCHLVSLQVDIPAGATRHHFPIQEMPVVDMERYFTYHSQWDESEMVVRMRFSADGNEWTNWQVLRRDFRDPTATKSPLHLGEADYRFFEWAVFNKGGQEGQLNLQFYHPSNSTIMAEADPDSILDIRLGECPNPEIKAPTISAAPTVVSTDQDDD